MLFVTFPVNGSHKGSVLIGPPALELLPIGVGVGVGVRVGVGVGVGVGPPDELLDVLGSQLSCGSRGGPYGVFLHASPSPNPMSKPKPPQFSNG